MKETEMQFEEIEPTKLSLDLTNPRFGLSEASDEVAALQTLLDTADLKELWNSIAERGYEKFEPLVAMKEGGKTVVLEGNRRLAAVKLLIDPGLLGDGVRRRVPALSPEKLSTCDTLPVILVNSRAEAAGYIGFKHVNGPTRWSSLAKAKFGVQFFERLDASLSPEARMQSLTRQLGDSRGLIIRLLVAYKIILQARASGMLDQLGLAEDEIEFSHLYTLINNPDSRNFIGLSRSPLHEGLIKDDPIPLSHVQSLRELMGWLYGAKSVIRSQGVDRPKLQRVLADESGLRELRSSGDLSAAVAVAGLQNEDWLELIAKLASISQKAASDSAVVIDDLGAEEIEQAKSLLDRTGRHLKQITSILPTS